MEEKKELEYNTIYNKAITLLSIREHTKKELERKLIEKGYEEELINEVIQTLLDNNLLSDKRFAESYIHSRLLKTPEGKALLLSRLKEKGCEKEKANEALNAIWEERDWLEPLGRAIEKQIRKKDLNSTIAFFRRKTFTLSEINEALELLEIDVKN